MPSPELIDGSKIFEEVKVGEKVTIPALLIHSKKAAVSMVEEFF